MQGYVVKGLRKNDSDFTKQRVNDEVEKVKHEVELKDTMEQNH